MKNVKTQKGITLIALIITIIVLLILAVVAIGAIQNDGIIEHAKEARDRYETAQNKEQIALNNYLEKLKENMSNEEEEEIKQITITGPDAVEVKREITLEVYDQANQKINSEDIEWSISWEWDEELGIVATVDNGVVTGESVAVEGIFGNIDVTVTAKYIPNKTIVATKTITVTPLECPDCGGDGTINEGISGYTCPECNEVYESVSELCHMSGVNCNNAEYDQEGHDISFPNSVYDDGYITRDELSLGVCENPDCAGAGVYYMDEMNVVIFPCGHYREYVFADEFYSDGGGDCCDYCEGGYIYY